MTREIRRSDRIAIFGKTGSGKTELARRYFCGWAPPRICIDVKDDLGDLLPGIPAVHDPEMLSATDNGGNLLYPSARVVPPGADEDFYNAIYRDALQRRGTLIWMDEFNEVTKPNAIPDDMRRYILQGRSKGCGHIGVTQRPADVHPSLATQAEHIFIFWMSHDLDRKAAARMAGFRNVEELEAIYEELPEYSYIYVPASGRDDYVICDPVPDPGGFTDRLARGNYFGPPERIGLT